MTKINIAVACALVIAVAIIVAIVSPRASAPLDNAAAAAAAVVDTTSHRLGATADGTVTLVEFLDFECEVCGAVYPHMEEIREEYAGRVTFVVRYFPMPGHKNSSNAAIAVEAAAQQNQFEAMYSKMFTTQPTWGESQESKAALFRSFAEELGLNLTEFDAAVADPATAHRVRFDFDAGRELGVQGTPTFFVNGQKIEISSVDDIRAALDAALTP